MRSSLEKALQEAQKLPPEVQDQLADEILEAISAELHWDETLEHSQRALEKMARAALRASHRGEAIEKGFDEL